MTHKIATSCTFVVGMLLLCTSALAYTEEVQIKNNYISITGHLTEAEREADATLKQNRMSRIAAIGQAEIEHTRNMDIEVAKYAVAIKLEEASATQVNVNAYASNSNDVAVSNVTDNTASNVEG